MSQQFKFNSSYIFILIIKLTIIISDNIQIQNQTLPSQKMSDSFSNSQAFHSNKRLGNHNSRSYLNLSHSMNQQSRLSNSKIQNTPNLIGYQTSNLSTSQNGVIYGTNISTKHVYTLLQAFIMEYQVNTELNNGQTLTQKIYHTQLSQMDIHENNVFVVSGKHLKQFDNDLYYQFIYFPAQMTYIFDQTIKNIYDKLFIANQTDEQEIQKKLLKKSKLMSSIKQLQQTISLKDINHKSINRLVSIRGIVIRCSQIIPQMLISHFKCLNCQHSQIVSLENAKINQPKVCQRCKLKDSLQIQHNLSQFTDKQFVKFQQLPELVPEGETPSSMTLIAYDYNVDKLRPGDRISVVGIYRTNESKVQKNRKIIRSVFNTYIDIISSQIVQDKGLKISDDTLNPIYYNDDDKQTFLKMADNPNIINDLVESFAPSIYGHEQLKKGLLTQLFGGTKKKFQDIGSGRFRSDINICLVGDPSTAKSQLLQQVHKISPRGIYTSGRGSSAVGLTANIKKDPQTKQFVLQSGALVLSDLGTCCIDQFDKMDPQSRLILLQAMQQQTISIAKAGIVCQLNSRAAILCAANPLHSRYNPKKSVVENINLTPALLTRFDLIYILLDQPNQTFDRMLATHILNIYAQDQQQLQYHNNYNNNLKQKNIYPKQLLSKYITYAKQYIHPNLTQQAGEKLIEAYSQMRKLGSNKKIITATTRQLQSLIRISEAFAKMRLSDRVIQKDVQQAIALVKYATQQAATDPTTGLIDMDVIVTGKTASSRQKINKIRNVAYDLIRGNPGKYKKTAKIQEFILDVDKRMDIGEKVTDKELLQALRILQSQNIIALFGPNKNKPNFKLAKDLHTL